MIYQGKKFSCIFLILDLICKYFYWIYIIVQVNIDRIEFYLKFFEIEIKNLFLFIFLVGLCYQDYIFGIYFISISIDFLGMKFHFLLKK